MHRPRPTPPVREVKADAFYRRGFTVVTIAILAFLLFRVLQPFLGSITWALLAAFLLHPAHRRLSGWLRGRASLSAVLLTMLTLLICIGPLTGLTIAFVKEAAALLQHAQETMHGVNFSDINSLNRVPILHQALQKLDSALGISPEQLQTWAISGTQSALKFFASASGWVFMSALDTLIGFGVMIVLLFFFLRDGAAMHTRLVPLVPMPEAHKRRLINYLSAVTRAVIVGTLLTALIQGALVGMGFLIVGLPSPVVFGVLAAMLALLPIGGTALVWIPAAIFLAAHDRYGAATFMTIWGALLVGVMDNFIKPMLISGRAEVPTLAAFLGVLGGLAAFGAVGMFLGPVLLALTVALLRYAQEHQD